ncbi:hypothetical protein Efla_002423 [Eimeria flavescens]
MSARPAWATHQARRATGSRLVSRTPVYGGARLMPRRSRGDTDPTPHDVELRTQILPASASTPFPASPNDSEREESEAKERRRERTHRGDAPGARSPRSPSPGPVSSPGEQGLLSPTQVPRLQGSPSLGLSPNEGSPSSAESSSQQSASEEPPAPPPAPGDDAANGS